LKVIKYYVFIMIMIFEINLNSIQIFYNSVFFNFFPLLS